MLPATLCLPAAVRAAEPAGLEGLKTAAACLAIKAADFFAGRLGEEWSTFGEVITIFSLTRAGVEERTWFTGRAGGGGGGDPLQSLQLNKD